MVLIVNFVPTLAGAEVGHRDVPVDFGNDFGQLDLVGDRLEQLKDRRAADDRNGRVARRLDGAVDIVDDIDSLDLATSGS